MTFISPIFKNTNNLSTSTKLCNNKIKTQSQQMFLQNRVASFSRKAISNFTQAEISIE